MIYSSFSQLLIHLWIGLVSCAVYHIVPSPVHHCPVESCLTLSSFAANTSLYLDNNTSLIFQSGSHTIRSQLNVRGVVNFSMISDQPKAGITSENKPKAGFIFNGVNHVHISNLKFYVFGYGSNLITLNASSLVLMKCTFEDNVKVISAAHSNITVVQSTFKNNHQSSYFNGQIINVDVSNFLIYDTEIISNKAHNNVINAKESVVIIHNNTFMYNEGSVSYINCKVDIFNSVFNHNKADKLIDLYYSKVSIHGSEFKENTGSAMKCRDTLISFSETCTIANNQALEGGAIYLDLGVKCFVSHGAIVIILNNTASESGGGMYLNEYASLTLRSQSMLQILKNAASKDGGGIYLSMGSKLTLHSQSMLEILENKATKNGGGIFASTASFLDLEDRSHSIGQTSNSTIYFHGNQARTGGGLYLEINSVVYIFPCLNNTINFDNNSADYGGAMYVLTEAESPPPKQLKLFKVNDYPRCFIQSEILQNLAQNYNISNGTIMCNKKPFIFSLNRANCLGFTLYKDAFQKCSNIIDETSFDEFKLLSILSNIQTSDIGSFWVQVCFCENKFPDCSRQISYVSVKTGEKLIVDVAIVDKRNHTVSGSIKSKIRGSVHIRDDHKIQYVINGCTALVFNVYSFEVSQQLILSPQLKNDSIFNVISTADSERSVQLNFLACTECPIGFQQIKDNARGCDCVCDVMKLGITSCNYTRETIIKKGTTAWIDYLSVKNTSDYLIYPYCPMDYCFQPDAIIEINLNIQNGADAQCAHNRSGLLCGACSPGLSLSLGFSHCLPCHANWPGVLVAIIFGSLLAGFFLIASLLTLNLTIATGTLNGLIFYANIVAANQHKFFPVTNFVTVFVSWFNLELGMDTCFFDGMDFYWKTWIQLAFPAYILLLVVLVIIVSEHSLKFADIVAKGNPLATLNTLILLSYVKFLRTIILVFSFATLDYPDGSHPVVWWPDATVGYFSGKHIVLCVVAAFILVAGIFYTAILFSWQWLLYYQHKKIFKWITQNQRLCMFIEPNHAPYAFKHRYWAGLLLLVRVIVYIISTADVASDRTITLLATGIITFFLTILICTFRPYKRWPVQILEIISYANIMCLCFATSNVSKVGKSQDVIAYISGTMSLVLFLIILSYHAITQLFFATQFGKKLKNKLAQQFGDTETQEQVNLVAQDKMNDEPVTYSVVDPPTREELQPHPDVLRSRKDTTNNVSENADCEENELKPIELKVADSSSTPYILLK